MRKRNESKFTTEFGRSWRAAGGYWEKIPDVGGQLSRFGVKRPFDVLASMNNRPMVIEVKACETKVFALKEFRPHQVPALERAAQAGFYGAALVVYERLSLMVADLFDVRVIVQQARAGATHLGPELAVMRFYAKNKSAWNIEPDVGKRLT